MSFTLEHSVSHSSVLERHIRKRNGEGRGKNILQGLKRDAIFFTMGKGRQSESLDGISGRRDRPSQGWSSFPLLMDPQKKLPTPWHLSHPPPGLFFSPRAR